MFGIFRQHANDGAALMFTAGPGRGEAIGTFQGKPLYHASLAREDYESLLAANGFRLRPHSRRSAVRWGDDLSCQTRYGVIGGLYSPAIPSR